MTSFSYALVMMHAMLYIRVQDTGGHERLLTPEPLQRREENRTSYCAQRHERRYQRVFVTVKMQGLVHTNGGTRDQRLVDTRKNTTECSKYTQRLDQHRRGYSKGEL